MKSMSLLLSVQVEGDGDFLFCYTLIVDMVLNFVDKDLVNFDYTNSMHVDLLEVNGHFTIYQMYLY